MELTLMVPWIFFLFVGAFDFGFYAYALISVQNAARVAALGTGSSPGSAASQPLACLYAREELQKMPNAASMPVECDGSPLTVTVEQFTDSENKLASRVRITYQTVPLIPIPGLLSGQLTVTRTAEMRVFGE